MRLEISNLAKIKHADLKMDGITVIAGENNTGKTTIGKALYCLFNSLYDIDNQIERNKRLNIKESCNSLFRFSLLMKTRISEIRKMRNMTSGNRIETICDEIADEICKLDAESFERKIYSNIIYNSCVRNDIELSKDDLMHMVEDSYEKIETLVKTDNRVVALQMVFEFFDIVFSSQIQTLSDRGEAADITLTIKDKPFHIAFKDNKQMKIDENDINIIHQAFLIDDPFVIDDLRSQRKYLINERYRAIRPRDFLINKIAVSAVEDVTNIYDSVVTKEKIQNVLKIINGIVPGEVSSKDDKWTLSAPFYGKPVDFYNLSAGLKSFVLLKLLLEKGILKEKDVLILDEPEIHLHPEWQIKYAEIIVLLQKEFDLSIVVTTHSRDFLEAIDLFSRKHHINKRCNYYLSKQSEGLAEFENVSDDVAKIYSHLVNPSMLLDRIRFELEDEEDE